MSAEQGVSVELLKLLYMFSMSLGLWTCLSVLLNRRCPSEAKIVLLLFIALLLVIPLNSYLSLAFGETPHLLFSLASTSTWFYGPLIWTLLGHVVHSKQSYKRLLIHVLPFTSVTALHYFRLQWLDFTIYQSALMLQVAVYLGASIFTLYRYRAKISVLGKEFRNSSYFWMLYLVAGLAAIVIYDLTMVLLLHSGVAISYYWVAATVSAFSVYISTISLCLLIQPDVFAPVDASGSADEFESEQALRRSHSSDSESGQGTSVKSQPDLALEKLQNTVLVSDTDSNTKQTKAKNLELSTDAARELALELDRLMLEQKLYLDPDLSLSSLAEKLGVTKHQLSELLNSHLNTSFYDMLNSHRFEQAVSLMDNKPKQHSVTDIAYLSGFNNRNSFYRVFKKKTGLTPGEYQKQRQNSEKQY
ncbi:helix-turn-helix domain-containing protein [Agaribacterium sp. ZY112]|uniref:helix-turn-helix domain-containing protein n=1 Tax=Agaribacterium sp. ZY112 TaxID=3233574 RepID=UPI003525512A